MQLAGEIINRRKDFDIIVGEVILSCKKAHPKGLSEDEEDDYVVEELNGRIRQAFDDSSLPAEWKHSGVAVNMPGVVMNLLRDPNHLPKRGESVANVDEMLRIAGRQIHAGITLKGLSVAQFDGSARYTLENTLAAAIGVSPQAVKCVNCEAVETQDTKAEAHMVEKGKSRRSKRKVSKKPVLHISAPLPPTTDAHHLTTPGQHGAGSETQDPELPRRVYRDRAAGHDTGIHHQGLGQHRVLNQSIEVADGLGGCPAQESATSKREQCEQDGRHPRGAYRQLGYTRRPRC